MPNELNIALATTGLAVTCQPYQSGAAVGSAISCPETGSTGFYSGNMAGSAGTYQLAFRAAGANVGSGNIVWDGTAEIATSTLTQANVQSALTAQGLTTARAGALDNLDTTVSSRLSPSGTLATVTNLTNAPASVTPSDIWSHASRTITGGTVDTLTNAPSVPSAATIASQVRTELGTELGRIDAAISSRLAPSGTLATVTNLTNAPASVTPSDIWSHASRTLTTSSGPTAVEIRQEIDANSTKLDAAISTRMAASEATKLDSIKGKTDLLNTDRLSQVATTNIVGTLLAQANS